MVKLKDIFTNPANPRIIKDAKFQKLVKSIDEFPKMMELRPIIVDSEGMILGGNMRYKALKDLGYKEIPDTWLKRADDLTEDEIRRFTIADNVGFGEWDYELLANEWDVAELNEWGLDLPDLTYKEDETYSSKIESPIYEPKGEKPKENELFDLTAYEKLLSDIKKAQISDHERLFLELAATRHIKFDYRKIANFYAHSGNNVQSLIEDSALIIIDYEKAIEKGFVKLYEDFVNLADVDV